MTAIHGAYLWRYNDGPGDKILMGDIQVRWIAEADIRRIKAALLCTYGCDFEIVIAVSAWFVTNVD